MDKSTAKEPIIIAMETNILESGLRIRRMEMVCFSMHQVLFTMESGLTIKPQIRGKLSTPTRTSTRATS